MKRLLLLRHAKSSWDDHSLSDHQRPLNQRGIADAALMAKQVPWTAECILCSSATRTSETASILIQQLGIDSNKVAYRDSLYMASSSQIMHTLQSASDDYETLMLIAHNPGVTNFVTQYTNMSPPKVPTCSMFAMHWECASWGLVFQQNPQTLQFLYPALFR